MEGSIRKKDREKHISSRMHRTHSTKRITNISGGGGPGGGGLSMGGRSMGTPPNRKKRKSGD